MITELTRTDTDLRRPLTGDSAATSNDGAESDSAGAFAAILAPMSVDGARTAADGQPSGAGNTGKAGCGAPCTDHGDAADASTVTQEGDRHSALEGVAAHERTLSEASGDNSSLVTSRDELSVNAVQTEPREDAGAELALQNTSSPDGNSGKLLPPGGNNAQALAPGSFAGATDQREWTEAGQDIEVKSDQSADASVAAAVAGKTAEAAQPRQSASGSEIQQKSASVGEPATVAAGTPRNAGTSNSSAADVSLNTAAAGRVNGAVLSERSVSERASKASADPVLQANRVEAGNPLVSGAGGLIAELSTEASALFERGHAAVSAELRSGDRLLTDRPVGELMSGDRAPRLAMQQFAGQPGWGEEIQAKLQWLSRQGLHRAELQLHPAELGSIEVRITAEQDQTSVVFFAASRTARDLLEAEIPRLRELFSQAGVELGHTEVSERESGDPEFASRDESHDERHSSTTRNDAEPAETPMQDANLLSVSARGSRGMIDYYI